MIAEKVEGQLIHFLDTSILFDGVDADGDDRAVVFRQLSMNVSETSKLYNAERSPESTIENKQHRAA